jgi:hypothetical protein
MFWNTTWIELNKGQSVEKALYDIAGTLENFGQEQKGVGSTQIQATLSVAITSSARPIRRHGTTRCYVNSWASAMSQRPTTR